MELIPILSLIILVATISTFILAVGAYVLYKVRERKGKKSAVEQPAAIGAELVTPTRVVEETRSSRRTATGGQIYTRETATEPRYSEDLEPEMRPTFVAPRETRSTRTNATRYTSPRTRDTFEGERYTSSQKFKRYSRPENTNTKEVKKEESLRWR
ncbi:MAG: hypothetical protein PF445_00410 [Melioribacteraceae bacterium]|jgi:uncharacterized membrane protein|nr:hypothetical protein [Melioribacteraceae bacterium]